MLEVAVIPNQLKPHTIIAHRVKQMVAVYCMNIV